MHDGIRRLFEGINHALLNWATLIYENRPNKISKRQLEQYFQQMIETSIVKSWYYRRLNNMGFALDSLDSCHRIFHELRQSENPDSLYICAKYRLIQGVLLLDTNNYNQAIDKYNEALKLLNKESNIRCCGHAFLHERKFSQKALYKIRRNFLLILISIFNTAIIYSIIGLPPQSLESFRTCKWIDLTGSEIFPMPANQKSQTEEFIRFAASDEAQKLQDLEQKIKDDIKVLEKQEKQKGKKGLSPDEMKAHIDFLWKKSTGEEKYESRQTAQLAINQQQEHKERKEWKSILNNIHGKQISNSRPVTPTAEFRITKARKSIGSNPIQKFAKVSVQRQEKKLKLLNPDEYFRSKICGRMNIEENWLEESNPKLRFRQHLIEQIRESERQSMKAAKILKDYLMVKHRDKLETKNNDRNFKEVEKCTRNEMSFKVLSIKQQLSPLKGQKSEIKPLKRKTDLMKTPKSFRSSSTTFRIRTQSTDHKKEIVATAEELQREIYDLEKQVGMSQNNTPIVSKLAESLKFIKSEQADKYNELAKSTVVKGKKDTILKSTSKLRTSIIASGFLHMFNISK